MALRTIITKGDPVLNKKAHPVTNFDEKLAILLDDMVETLRDSGGVGLAAPQIGILRRVVVVINEADQVIELVNPEIIATEGEQVGFEGCLSVPGRWGKVKRPMKARVRAQNRQGEWFEVEDEGLTARCFCHELDHLDGHLFTELTDKLYTSEELDKLMEQGIGSQLRRVPTQLLRSCGQALYLNGQDLQRVLAILAQSQIDTRGIFMVTHGSGSPAYRRIQ